MVGMENFLRELGTSVIVLNSAFNYIVWTHFASSDKVEKVFHRTLYWNLGLAATIMAAGAYKIYHLNEPAADKALSFAKVLLHALAIGLSGAALSHWCFTALRPDS